MEHLPVVIGIKSSYAQLKHDHIYTCRCGRDHSVSEFKEPLINDPGTVVVKCVCGETKLIELTTNVDGAELSPNLSLVEYTYCEE